MKGIIRQENGMVFVEAAMILPICLIIILTMLYITIYQCQRANLQANLENALIYFKNSETDDFISTKERLEITRDGGLYQYRGNQYDVSMPEEEMWPYRIYFSDFDASEFEAFFKESCKYMFFADADNTKVEAKCTNYLIYRSIEATVSQEIRMPFNMEMFGIPNELTIHAAGTVVISDTDEFIRDADLVVDLLMKNEKFANMVQSLASNVKKMYDSVSNFFGVKK